MTIQDIMNMDKDVLTPGDIAPILGCDPNLIRHQAKEDVNSFGFPVCKLGSRVKIPRLAFIAWYLKGVSHEDN